MSKKKKLWSLLLFLMVAMLPSSSFSQVQTSKQEVNDSTEFILRPKLVVDTAKVEEIAMKYRKKQKDILKQHIDSLSESINIMNMIINLTEKEKLSDENGTLAMYTQFFEELKEGNSENAKIFKTTYFWDAEMQRKTLYDQKVHYNREIAKAEKKLTKKLLTYPIIVKYIKLVCDNFQDKINEIERDMTHYDQKDIYSLYLQCKGNREYPQKEIYVRTINENYRPAILREVWKFSNYNEKIDEIDLERQQLGWEWVNDDDNRYSGSESYPHEYDYYGFKSHPEYRSVYVRDVDGSAIFDKEGNFIRFLTLSHENIIRRHNPNLIEALLMLEYRNDYANNKYNIKKEDKDVQYAIVNKLGLSKESVNKRMNAIENGMKGGMLYKYSHNWQESIKGYVQRDKAAKQMVVEMLRLTNDTALKYLDQLKKDHEEDFKYIYKIERLSNVSFKVKFVTKDLQPRCDVVITYYQVKPFSCDWRIDEIIKP